MRKTVIILACLSDSADTEGDRSGSSKQEICSTKLVGQMLRKRKVTVEKHKINYITLFQCSFFFRLISHFAYTYCAINERFHLAHKIVV